MKKLAIKKRGKKSKITRCYISIPRDFIADKILESLSERGIKIIPDTFMESREMTKADYVIVLLRKDYVPGFVHLGVSSRKKKRALAIQNSDYKNIEWIDKYKIKR